MKVPLPAKLALSFVVGFLVSYSINKSARPLSIPTPTEVYVNGKWLPVVKETDSYVVEYSPPYFKPGQQVVRVNGDGTACLVTFTNSNIEDTKLRKVLD